MDLRTLVLNPHEWLWTRRGTSSPVSEEFGSARSLRSQRVAVGLVFFATGATFGTWASRIPAVQEQVGLSASELGVALAGQMVGAFVALPLAGMTVAWAGSRRLLAGSVLLFVPLLGLLPHAPTLPALAALLVVFGAGNSGVDVAMNTQGTHVERRYAVAVMSSFHAMFSVGALAGAGVGALLAAHDISPVAHFPVVAAALATVALASIAWMTDEPGERGTASRLALPGRALAIPGAVAFAMVFAEEILNTWSAVFLRTQSGASPAVAAAGFAVYSAGTLAGRLGADRLVRRRGPLAALQTGGGFATIGAALTIAVAHPLGVNAGFFLLGLGVAPVLPVLFSVVSQRDAAHAGTAITAVTTIGYLGSVIGPPLIGILADASTLRLAFLTVPVATLAMTLLPHRIQGA